MKKLTQVLSCYSTIFKTIRRNILGKKFEPEVSVLDKFVKSGSACFDIGAAYGRYAFAMSRLAGSSGHIYCFEPGDYSHKVLTSIVKFHRLKNVTLVKKGVSDKKGFSQLSIPIKKKGKLGISMAHLGPGKNSNQLGQQIEITTIDNYCSEAGLKRLDFIKCDVEGAELLVFKGGEKTISAYKPTVFCEVDKDFLKRFNFTPGQVYDFFKEKGYKAYVFEKNELKEISRMEANNNYIFRPKDNL